MLLIIKDQLNFSTKLWAIVFPWAVFHTLFAINSLNLMYMGDSRIMTRSCIVLTGRLLAAADLAF